ncbi:hypothetical protein BC936DRAFT_141695 [Jimgerdemannia flammicorona]|uniref:Uncharacterized protein n=1 Tax=Jimgerdemannia flammicorona TaxID=994334 RepID=A0A433A1T3_9FUNG|nr:hypothetical protein BC936DRAFT_141695 [Jimgerdemannia flammicorona]
MESNGLGFDLTLLDINLVTAENDGDVLADTDEVAVPVGHVLVGDTGGDIKHNDSTLALDAMKNHAITETTKFLLAGGIPGVEDNSPKIGVEGQRMDLNTEGGYFGGGSNETRRQGRPKMTKRGPLETCGFDRSSPKKVARWR